MKPVSPKDDLLVYALGCYFGMNATSGRSPRIAASLLLVLHRATGPLHKERLQQAASFGSKGDSAFRMVLWSAREGIGKENIIKDGDFYVLSPLGKIKVGDAMRDIRRQLDASINGGREVPESPHLTVV